MSQSFPASLWEFLNRFTVSEHGIPQGTRRHGGCQRDWWRVLRFIMNLHRFQYGMGAGGEAGGWDTAPICSSDMAYIRNSISGVRLRAGCEDAGRAMMRPMARHSRGEITSRERGVFFNNADVLPYRSSRVLIINPFSSLLVTLIWMRFIFATTFLMDVSHLLIYTRWSLSRSHHAAILHWCFLIPRVLRELLRTPQTTAAICGIIGWK